MKKLMIALAVVALAAASQAASMSWNYAGTSAQVGWNVYLVIGSTPITEMTSVAEFAADTAHVFSPVAVKKSGFGSSVSYAASTDVNQDSRLPKGTDYYFVLIDGTAATAENFYTSAVFKGSNIYDLDANPPESNPGSTDFAFAKMNGPTKIGDVPEPTSAMLMLLGVAGLALRRRRA